MQTLVTFNETKEKTGLEGFVKIYKKARMDMSRN